MVNRGKGRRKRKRRRKNWKKMKEIKGKNVIKNGREKWRNKKVKNQTNLK